MYYGMKEGEEKRRGETKTKPASRSVHRRVGRGEGRWGGGGGKGPEKWDRENCEGALGVSMSRRVVFESGVVCTSERTRRDLSIPPAAIVRLSWFPNAVQHSIPDPFSCGVASESQKQEGIRVYWHRKWLPSPWVGRGGGRGAGGWGDSWFPTGEHSSGVVLDFLVSPLRPPSIYRICTVIPWQITERPRSKISSINFRLQNGLGPRPTPKRGKPWRQARSAWEARSAKGCRCSGRGALECELVLWNFFYLFFFFVI